jgi:hypothetical protein
MLRCNNYLVLIEGRNKAKRKIKTNTDRRIKMAKQEIKDPTETIKDATKDAFRNLNTFVEPWVSATKTAISESEKYQQTAFDNMNKAIDNSYRMAREGLDIAASMGTTYQKQVSAQVDRTVSFINSLIS